MNIKLLAGLAIAVVLMGVGSQTFVHSVFADSNQNRAQAKATAQKAGQEQALILKEMEAKDHAHVQIKN